MVTSATAPLTFLLSQRLVTLLRARAAFRARVAVLLASSSFSCCALCELCRSLPVSWYPSELAIMRSTRAWVPPGKDQIQP